MSTHEVRFRGALIEHLPEAEARAYVKARLAHPVEGEAFDASDWSVQPRRPVELRCAGNLVETFDTRADAEAYRDKKVAEARGRRVRPMVDAWHIEGP